MKKKYFEVSRSSAFSIKVLGKCIYTYYNHLIMQLNKRKAVFDFQSSDDFVAKTMTKEVMNVVSIAILIIDIWSFCERNIMSYFVA